MQPRSCSLNKRPTNNIYTSVSSPPSSGRNGEIMGGELSGVLGRGRGLPPEVMKFAINASIDSLPTNANLHLWRKKDSDVCCLCQEGGQSLLHVLNHCQVAMELRRYSRRHDEVLKAVYLPPCFVVTVPNHTSFPTTSSQLTCVLVVRQAKRVVAL